MPHIYLSALPFTPRESKIFQQYSLSFPGILQCERPRGSQFPGHNHQVTSVCFSSEGEEILSGAADGTIRTWDAHTGDAVAQPASSHRDWVIAVAFAPDTRHCVLSASYDNSLGVWDSRRGALLKYADIHTYCGFVPHFVLRCVLA